MTLGVSLLGTAAMAVPAGGYGDLVEAVAPVVVFIEVEGKTRTTIPLPENLPEELRRRYEQQSLKGAPRAGLGSGFIISPDSQVVTNAHVVDGPDHIPHWAI